jgi:hypothetical protein
MKKLIGNHFVTCVAILIAVPVFLGIFFTEFDVIDTGLKNIIRVENSEMDELVTAFLIVIFGLVLDQLRARSRARRRFEIEEQRLRVLKATMRTVQDLVNNFLQNMQLFRLEAEDGPLSLESLKLFDDLSSETSARLTALGNSKVVSEIQMASGTGIEPS